jgi:hypothetical protein
VLNAAEQSEFNFDQDLLPNLLNLFEVVFMRSVPDEVAFHEMRTFKNSYNADLLNFTETSDNLQGVRFVWNVK